MLKFWLLRPQPFPETKWRSNHRISNASVPPTHRGDRFIILSSSKTGSKWRTFTQGGDDPFGRYHSKGWLIEHKSNNWCSNSSSKAVWLESLRLGSKDEERQCDRSITSCCLHTVQFCSFGRLIAKLPQPGDREVTFRSSSQAATCYYQSNHSKVEAISLSALFKDTTSELSGLSPH